MDRHPEGWTVGMEVCVVETLNRREPLIETKKIAKIGRRWITLEGDRRPDRFDAETMALDGGNFTSPGRVYVSRDHYEQQTERASLWADFRLNLPYSAPDCVTADRIRNLMTELCE